jgi:predicted TIM-barrel fold metal-dependent hydrolase
MMSVQGNLSRRGFLSAAGGTFAVSRLHGQAKGPGGTKRATRVDCQSHLFVPEIVSLMKRRGTDPVVYQKDGAEWVKMGDWHRKILPNHMDVQAKLQDMDANGIDLTALSINDPGPEWFGAEAPAVARTMNDFVAGVVRQHPERFLGLCVLPLQDRSAAETELNRCVNNLRMRGVLLYSNLAGAWPDEPQFRWLFARAVELGIPILLHPAKPSTMEQVKGHNLISTLGNMFENTIALARIIAAGLLDEFPQLKLVCPHLGGALPYICGRFDHQVAILKRSNQTLKRKPSEYIRSIYMDIVSPLPLAMKFAVEFSGTNRLLFASDHPWVDPKLILESLQSLKLPAMEEDKIMGGNARQLFRLTS